MTATYFDVGLNARRRPPLDGDCYVDALVVGGGYAGVAAVKTFAEQGLSALLIERDTVGAAASGRNGGMLIIGEGAHLSESDADTTVQSTLGKASAELLKVATDAKEETEFGQGTIRLATTARQARGLAKLASPSTTGEATSQFLDTRELRAHVRSDRYQGGLLDRTNIAVNPRTLLERLAQAAEAEGARIVEHTRATSVRQDVDGQITVDTDRGRITAGRLVVATAADLGDLVPAARRTLVKVHSQIGVTAPLDPALLDLALPTKLACTEVIVFARYFRRLAGNRLMFGISSVMRPVAEHDLHKALGTQLADTFPPLAGTRFDHAWSGVVASTIEETPWLTRIGPTSVVTLSNGVLASWHGGQVAAKATHPDFADYAELSGHRHGSWPPFHLPEGFVRWGGGIVFAARDRL